MSDEKKDIKSIHIYQGGASKYRVPQASMNVFDVQIEDVSVQQVMRWIQELGWDTDPTKIHISYHFKNKDELSLMFGEGEYHKLGKVSAFELSFGEHTLEPLLDDGSKDAWFSTNTQYFWPGFVKEAILVFIARLNSGDSYNRYKNPFSETLSQIKARQDQEQKVTE